MNSPESPLHPPSFYVLHSNSSIPPPTQTPSPPTQSRPSIVYTILPHLARRVTHSITSVLLPVALLPFHLFFLFLSIVTTLLAILFLSTTAVRVYLEIGMNTLTQVYSDYAIGGRKIGRRRRDLLRRVVLEREEAVRAEKMNARMRARGMTIA